MRLPIVREGWLLIKLFLMLTIAGYILGRFSKIFYLFGLCSLLFAVFFAFFFRDPKRDIVRSNLSGEQSQDSCLILSPADGKILAIEETVSPIKQKVVKIFMSPFDVHIQRAPVSGKVVNIEYKRGKFLPAYKEEASQENEQNVITVERESTRITETDSRIFANDKFARIRVTVRQIAGILARRILCWVKVGDYLTAGQKIGMIKFGSQVDISLPENIDLQVKIGDKVRAGLTVLASLFNNDADRFKPIETDKKSV